MASPQEREETLKGLTEAVTQFDEEKVAELSKRALELGIEPGDAILNGLTPGMERAGHLYEQQEYFVPELLLCSDALNAGLNILKPLLRTEASDTRVRVVIGTVEGDIHEIGKNLVRTMYEAAGWEVFDLGTDVNMARFVEEQKRTDAHVVALSALMTTSMTAMPEIITALKAASPRVTIMAGGAPLTEETAKRYGADGYADNCGAVVRQTLKALRTAREA
jgi:corrinoid protein of di/trimethylamine methyltransferase